MNAVVKASVKAPFVSALLVLAVGAGGASSASPPASSTASSDKLPLIMENADHMQGIRAKGEYILTGHVRFRHGDMHFATERALWDRDQNRVSCQTGMRVTDRGALLKSDSGSYDKNSNMAVADGHVFMHDSSGQVEGEGTRVTYDRVGREAVLTGHPLVRRLYPASSSKDSANKGPDTLVIRGKTLLYYDSTGIADATDNVVITRHDLLITCGHAEYRQKADSLFLSQDPKVKVQESEVKGVLMRLGLDGEELHGMLVKGNANAVSTEKATDSTRAHESHVEGDSLYMAFQKGAIESVQVFRSAKGSYFDVDRPQYVNRMSGDYMVLRFQEKHVHDAEVLGMAKSTYYHFEKDTLKGRNRAAGDTIDLSFLEGKISEVLVKGKAEGVYEGRGLGHTTKAKAAPLPKEGKAKS